MSAEEELDRIKEKYSRLKQANKVLKEGLLEKNEVCERLETQIKDKETLLKQQLEEIDHLQFQNGRVSKQLGTITAQLEEAKQRQNAGGGGWSVGNLITGKQQQEAYQRASEEIRALQDELQMKIEENEGLHMQIFECNREHEITEQHLQESVTNLTQELEGKSKELETENERTAALTKQVKSFTVQVSQLESDAKEAEAAIADLQTTLQRERDTAAERISKLEAQLKRLRPFDERRHRLWLEWELSSASGRSVARREKVVGDLRSPLSELCRQSAEVLKVWSRTFGAAAEGEDSASQRVRSKLAACLESLVQELGDSVPQLFTSTKLLDLKPDASSVGRLKVQSATLLTLHRKWVMYQSLLLLRDHQRSAASQTQQDAAQTLRLVESLWRLHKCSSALFARLRTLPCAVGLGLASWSASHFQSARGAMASRDYGSSSAVADSLPRFCKAIRSSLHELLQCWEGIGRALSAWSMAKVTLDSSSRGDFGDLLEVVHRFSSSFANTWLPAVDRWQRLAEEDCEHLSSDQHPSSARCFGSLRDWQPASPSSSSVQLRSIQAPSTYISRSNSSLEHAPPAFGFAAAMLTRAAAQKLEASGSRLSAEVRQQVKRLQIVTGEKNALMEEFRTLQDEHALLRSNLQANPGGGSAGPSSQAAAAVSPPFGPRQGASPNEWQASQHPASFLTASRQRAMLDALSISSQETPLQQHGYFVDVLNLTSADVAYASSGPSGPLPGDVSSSSESATASWELAVRRVYEQHTRLLQAQIQAAEGKALELHIAVRDNLDRLKAEQEAKQSLRDEKDRVRLQLQRKNEELESTRKNYETQLAVLTEHLCDLSNQGGTAGLTSAQKVLCGRCGTWNNLTKLLGSAKNNAGTCLSCKEKVLSLA